MTEKYKKGIALLNEILELNLSEDYHSNIRSGRTITATEMFEMLDVIDSMLAIKCANGKGILKMVHFSEDRFKNGIKVEK